LIFLRESTGEVVYAAGRRWDAYTVEEVVSGFPGTRGFFVRKKGSGEYAVLWHRPGRYECECLGFLSRDYCRHGKIVGWCIKEWDDGGQEERRQAHR
jgi:hypothetical protein